VAEIRVFHEQQFLCRAICPELAGATIPIREIVRARNQHRRDLQATVRDRRRTVDELMEIKRGDARAPQRCVVTWNNYPATPVRSNYN
jgi:putative transposase